VAQPQNVNTNHPADIPATQPVQTAESRRDQAARAQMQKDVDELSQLCSQMTPDLQQVKQGMLPKDIANRLARMEKLSKRVRQQLTQ
jgi:hypothetical protein